MWSLESFANTVSFYSSVFFQSLSFVSKEINRAPLFDITHYGHTFLALVILALIAVGMTGIARFYLLSSGRTALPKAGSAYRHLKYNILIAEFSDDTPGFLTPKLVNILHTHLKSPGIARYFNVFPLRRRFPLEKETWKQLVNHAPDTHDVLLRGLKADLLLWAKTDKACKRLKLTAFHPLSSEGRRELGPADFGPSELEPLPVDHLAVFAPALSLFALAQIPVPDTRNKQALADYACQVDKLSKQLDQTLSNPPADMPSSFRFTLKQLQAWSMFIAGMAYGDHARLGRAIRFYESLLSDWPSHTTAFLQGQTLSNLAFLKSNYAQRQSGLESLEQSLDAITEAQQIFTRVDYPVSWAQLQDLRAQTQIQLGQRQADISLLEAGIHTLRTTSRIWNTPRYQLNHANVQKRIAAALRQLGLGSPGTERLEQAVAAYYSALAIYKSNYENKKLRHTAPFHLKEDLTQTLLCLGETLVELGEKEGNRQRFEDAASHLRQAVTLLRPIPDNKVTYARVLLTLGRACTGFSLLQDTPLPSHHRLSLSVALHSLKKAYKTWPIESAGEKIQTLETLGVALTHIAAHSQHNERQRRSSLEESIKVFKLALETFNTHPNTFHRSDLTSPDPARLYASLGRALTQLANATGTEAPIQEAVGVYHKAITLTNRESSPWDWTMLQNQLGDALTLLAKRSCSVPYLNLSGNAVLDAAIQAYRDALGHLHRNHSPLLWAQIRHKLGEALALSGALGGGTPCLELAVESYGKALEEWSAHSSPHKRALVLSHMGNALADIGRRESNGERIEQARKAFSEAYDLFASLGQGSSAKRAQDNISTIDRIILKDTFYDPAKTFRVHLAE